MDAVFRTARAGRGGEPGRGDARGPLDRLARAPSSRRIVVGTFELLEATRGVWAAQPAAARARFRFLHVSTDEVYGSLGPTGILSEEDALRAELALRGVQGRARTTWCAPTTRRTACPRSSRTARTTTGRASFPEKLIPLMILNAVEGRAAARSTATAATCATGSTWRITARGSCSCWSEGALGERYNIGGGGERTNLEVTDCLCAALEAALPAARESGPRRAAPSRGYDALRTFVTDRPGHDRRYAIDRGQDPPRAGLAAARTTSRRGWPGPSAGTSTTGRGARPRATTVSVSDWVAARAEARDHPGGE